jgi:subtilase family serine protease
MRLAIILPLRNQSELKNLLKRLYDPSSPDYRHFLSVDQFTERFGPTAHDYEAVVKFARSKGFRVTDTAPNRLLVHINGTVSQINKAFHVAMTTYRHPTEKRTFYSPDREPSLDLIVPVVHIAGLNNFSIPRPKFKRAPANFRRNATGSGPSGAYLGSDMRAAYYGGTVLSGSGQAVGLLEFDGYSMSDVTASFAGQSNSVPIHNVLIDGASAASDGDDGEQVLDIVQAASMAPGMSQIRVYIAPGNSQIGVGDVDLFNEMATENVAKQLSCSWGWNPDDSSQLDPIFQEFAAQGQNLFVASGDAGAYTGSNSTDNSYPAESVYVVAVGGTDLTTNGAGGPWRSETAWLDSSGGPADDGFAIPSWQAGVANSSNQASTTIRNVPDVAAEANTDNYLCDQGSCTGDYGGTSFAAPRWAGFLALVNQQVAADGNLTLGFVNPTIYSIGRGANYNNDLHDITSGNNNNGHGQSYNAVIGYDLVTGWGSPNGQNLINALAGSPAVASLASSPVHARKIAEKKTTP